MYGIRVFSSMQEALREGYHVYERRQDGYLVRMRVQESGVWGFAFVHLIHAND